jgi:hypothetical protein
VNAGHGDLFRGAVANPSVSTPIVSVGLIKGTSKENYQPTTENRGFSIGFGPGLGAFLNYTDYQAGSRIIPWLSLPASKMYVCPKTGIGCSGQ